MKRFLIDTDICIFRIRGCGRLESKFDDLNETNAFVSEITISRLQELVPLHCPKKTNLPKKRTNNNDNISIASTGKLQVPESGVITLPPKYRGRKVVVSAEEEHGRTDQLKSERQPRIEAEKARIMDRTPEERRAAAEKFLKAWKGCLKGVPHMTTKEIRAKRLEKKYGQQGDSQIAIREIDTILTKSTWRVNRGAN